MEGKAQDSLFCSHLQSGQWVIAGCLGIVAQIVEGNALLIFWPIFTLTDWAGAGCRGTVVRIGWNRPIKKNDGLIFAPIFRVAGYGLVGLIL